MKIEFSKQDIRIISEALKLLVEEREQESVVDLQLSHLRARVKDIASWTQEQYERHESDQWRIERAGSEALYG